MTQIAAAAPVAQLTPVFDHGALAGFVCPMTDGSWAAELSDGVPFSFHETPFAAEYAVVERYRKARTYGGAQ